MAMNFKSLDHVNLYNIFDTLPSFVAVGIILVCLVLLVGVIVLSFRHRKIIRKSKREIFELEKTNQALQTKLNAVESLKTPDTVGQIATALWPLSGDLFFNSLVTHLSDILSADYVCVGKFVDNEDGGKISLISCFGAGKHLDTFDYALSGAPCEQTMRQGKYWVSKDVALQFPNFTMLRDLGIEGYVGLALPGAMGSSRGLLSVLFTQPIAEIDSVVSVLKIFAAWVSSELTRSGMEEILHRYYQIVDSSADLLAFVDCNFTYQAVNPTYLKLFNKRRDQIIGHSPAEVLGQQIFEETIKPKLDECFGGKETNVEFKIDLPDKSNRYIQSKLSPFLDQSGNITGVVVCSRDISALKQTEEEQALRASTLEAVAKYHTQEEALTRIILLAEKSHVGMLCSILLLDQDKKTLRSGAAPSLPKFYNEAFDGLEIGEEVGCCGTAAFTGKRVIVSDIRTHPFWAKYKALTSQVGMVSCWSQPIKSSKNQVLGTFAIYYQEVREPKSEDLALIESLASIAAISIERNQGEQERLHLENQLLQSHKMEAIGHLTGGIAHDFNNILGSILGFAGLALKRCVNSNSGNLEEYLSEIIRSGERARDLISKMLAFSQTGLNKSHPVKLQSLIDDSLKLLRPLLPAYIEIQVHIESDEMIILADSVQLEQVIVNLCINARDSMKGKGRIDIKGRISLDDYERTCNSCHSRFFGHFIELSVEDTGLGIEPELFKWIFDPFFTTKATGEGTGMGLSMVHGTVHKYGGHILVESSAEMGTLVRIFFPLDEALGDTVDFREVIQDQQQSESVFMDKHILVVDDEESLVMFLTDVLESKGFRVTTANSGDSALSIFLKDPLGFDLILTDQAMPKMTGVDLAKNILSDFPNTPIIVCTGFNQLVGDEGANRLGIKRFLQKPFDDDTLFAAVSEVLNRSQKAVSIQ